MTADHPRRPNWLTTARSRVSAEFLLAVADFVVAAFVALAAALLSFLIEDLLQKEGPHRLSAPVWALVALVMTLSLFGAIVWRRTVRDKTGTLFYVRILDVVMQDWHVQAVELARRRRLSLRSVTRWVDLPAQTRNGVIDVTGECADVAAALEVMLNGDSIDTAFTIAPNMLWHPALAVGAELPIVEDLRLLELPGPQAPPREEEVSFVLPVPETVAREPMVTPHPLSPDRPGGPGRVGLLLAFAPAALKMDPATVFARYGVSEYYQVSPASVRPDLGELKLGAFTGNQLAALAESLPAVVANIKRQAGTRELVVAAALPKTLALALGWGLAQQKELRFFAGTYLLHFDIPTGEYAPVRVHPSQPTTAADAETT